MRATRVSNLQAVACFIIAVAGLVPVFHENRPFWGLYCISFDDGPPKVHQVESDSPASASGLRVNDVIMAINGSAADFSSLMSALNALQPGDAVKLRVMRGEQELNLTAAGVNPPIAMIYYPTVWHPVAGVAGLALGLLVVATQPLLPVPRWRPALLGVVGLILATIFFLAIVNDNAFARWQVRRFHNLNGGAKWHFQQSWVGLVASLGVAILATLELRKLLLTAGKTEAGKIEVAPQNQGRPAN